MREPEQCAYREPHAHHAYHVDERRHYGRAARVDKFLEIELETEREEQHDYADLRPEFDIGLVGYRRQRLEIRTRKKSGHDISQYDRLLYPLEKKRHSGSEYQYECKVAYQTFYIHNISISSVDVL